MSYQCVAYGLVLQADSFIPGAFALPSDVPTDVRVWLGRMPEWRNEALTSAQVRYITPYENGFGEPVMRAWDLLGREYLRLVYADSTEFILDRLGTQIWVTWPSAQTLADTATYLLGPVLGLVLRLRGLTCLHASAVVLGERVIALMGPSGAGKSTTAAAFSHAGYKVLADDIVALDEQRSSFLVRPAYPRVRLWPSSVKALYGSEDALPLLTPSWDKHYLDLLESAAGYQTQSLPLAAIYYLSKRSSKPWAPFVEPLAANETLMTLVANTYATNLLDNKMRANEFGMLGNLNMCIPIRRVVPHADVEHLPKLCDVIREDLQTNVLAN